MLAIYFMIGIRYACHIRNSVIVENFNLRWLKIRKEVEFEAKMSRILSRLRTKKK